MRELGFHCLLDLWGVGPDRLDDSESLQALLVSATQDSGARVVDSRFSRFEPHGISGVVIIAESHVTLHTWPELGFAAIDVFTCGDPKIGEAICRRIIDALAPSGHTMHTIARGCPFAKAGNA